MKGVELLSFINNDQAEKLRLSAQNYLRFARIYFAIVSFDNNEVIVKVWQEENATGKYLNANELIQRGKDVFNDIIPGNIIIHFRPIPYKVDTLGAVNQEWVKKKMDQHNLRPKDLGKLLNIDKGSLSRLLSGEDMTKSSKAMFYYLFMYLEKQEV